MPNSSHSDLNKEGVPSNAETKKCSTCGKSKTLDGFHKSKRSKDGLDSRCILCKKELYNKNREKYNQKKREYYAENKEAVSIERRIYRENNKEKISMRKKASYEKNKEKVKLQVNKYRVAHKEEIAAKKKINYEANKEKFSKKSREYYEVNKERLLILNKKWREEHPEYMAAYQKEWCEINKEEIAAKKKIDYEANKEEIIARTSAYKTARRKVDVNYRMADNLRSRTGAAIKGNFKAGSAVRDLGCSIEYLKQYLKKSFYPHPKNGEYMNWENYGRGEGYCWNIDHIIPLSSFDLEVRKQFLEAAHYTNLQPLWFEDNMEKGSKLDWVREKNAFELAGTRVGGGQ